MTYSKFDHLPLTLVDDIRTTFKLMKAGDSHELIVPHRDMHPFGTKSQYSLFADRCEIPRTFSFEQLIKDALNAICPQVDKNMDEIDWQKVGIVDDGQGFWKLLDLKIEEGYIHATIHKL